MAIKSINTKKTTVITKKKVVKTKKTTIISDGKGLNLDWWKG